MLTISCSHCHALNALTGRPLTCRRCGHRADAPRCECDCRSCTAPARPAALPLSEAAAELCEALRERLSRGDRMVTRVLAALVATESALERRAAEDGPALAACKKLLAATGELGGAPEGTVSEGLAAIREAVGRHLSRSL